MFTRSGSRVLHQHRIGESAILELRVLEPLVVQELLEPRFLHLACDLVVLVRRPLHRIRRRHPVRHSTAEAGRAHLRHADVLGPLDLFGEIRAQGRQREVRARALHAVVIHDFSGRFAVGEAGEFAVARRAELDDVDADRFHVFEQSSEVALLNPRAVRIRLAADRQPQRTRAKRPAETRGHDSRDDCVRSRLPEELSSGDCSHRARSFRGDPEPGRRTDTYTSDSPARPARFADEKSPFWRDDVSRFTGRIEVIGTTSGCERC